MNNEVKEILKNTNEIVETSLKSLDGIETYTIQLELTGFEKPDFNITESERLKPMDELLKSLEKFKGKPCLYFFEILSGDTKEFLETYKRLELKNKSAIKKTVDYQTKCLYVGRSLNGIIHRLKVHFGYKNTTENSLQLLHWAKPLDMKLQIHLYFFPKELGFLLPLYERKVNRELKPLIGHL